MHNYAKGFALLFRGLNITMQNVMQNYAKGYA
jgi:hypothetical protein